MHHLAWTYVSKTSADTLFNSQLSPVIVENDQCLLSQYFCLWLLVSIFMATKVLQVLRSNILMKVSKASETKKQKVCKSEIFRQQSTPRNFSQFQKPACPWAALDSCPYLIRPKRKCGVETGSGTKEELPLLWIEHSASRILLRV